MARNPDCDRFEQLLGAPRDYRLTDDDVAFYLEHERDCPTGEHTVARLEQELGISPGTLARRFADTAAVEYPALGTLESNVEWALFSMPIAALRANEMLDRTMTLTTGPLTIGLQLVGTTATVTVQGATGTPSWRLPRATTWTAFERDEARRAWVARFRNDDVAALTKDLQTLRIRDVAP